MKAAMLIIKDDLTGVEIRALLKLHFVGMLAISRDVQAATEGLAVNTHISCYALNPPRHSRQRGNDEGELNRNLHDDPFSRFMTLAI